MNNLAIFEVGKTYSCRSSCDYNCIWTFKIIKRTAKTVTIENWKDKTETVTKRIGIYDNSEYVNPLGIYSMSPILRAKI